MDYPQAIVSIVMLGVFILLGVPVWWNTTKVYRAPLPHERIFELQSSSIKLKIDVRIFIENSAFSNDEFSRNALAYLYSNADHFKIEFQVDKYEVTEKRLDSICNDIETRSEDSGGKLQQYNIVFVNKLTVPLFDSKSRYYCQSGSTFIISTGDSTVDHLVDEVKWLLGTILPVNDINMKPTGAVRQSRMTVEVSKSLPLSPGYNMVFTLAIANPSDYLPTWQIEEAIELYVRSTLKHLDFLGPFHLSSQVLYFADVKVKPAKDENGTSFYYTKSKLPLLINPLESRLNTYTSSDTSLNFILYTPSKEHSPLYFRKKKSTVEFRTAFHSPRWGGIQIYNMPVAANGNHTNIDIEHLSSVMHTFLVQFLSLNRIQCEKHTEMFPANQYELLPVWARRKLLISKTFEHLKMSISTLASLSKLLDEIANIVIRDEVKSLIDLSVQHIDRSVKYTTHGDVDKAHYHAKEAFVHSEKAFYDPSLLALLYFPDDQKYAIYVPLFLPISLPVLISFFKAIKWLRSKEEVGKEKAE